MINRSMELAVRCGLALCIMASAVPVLAAGGIRTDGTVGANGGWLGRPQSLSGSDVTITQEMGSTAGRNLFHSFSEFNVNQGQTVTFTGDGALKNVISRVTGDSSSDIAGTLRSTVGKADVYLINPNGVAFAPGAQVDVPAAFHVSTADELRFKDGARYSARDPAPSSLSAAAPASFGYLGTSLANNGLIQVDGAQLEAQPGQTLDIAAGEIRVENGARLKAEAGEVRLTASRGAAEVSVERSPDGHLPLPEGARTESNAGDVNIDNASVDVSGDGSGRVAVSGGAARIQNGAQLRASNMGSTHAVAEKGIHIKSASLSVSQSLLGADSESTGDGVDISVDTSVDISFADGSTVAASAFDAGKGGNIRTTAGGSVKLLSGSQVYTTASGTGDAGDLSVSASGDVLVDGSGSAPLSTLLGSETDARGDAAGDSGELMLTGGSVSLVHGALLYTATKGSGDAGRVDVEAGGDIRLEDYSLLASKADEGSTGNAIALSVSAGGDVLVLNDSELSSVTGGAGHAGDVDISAARDVTVFGGPDRTSRVSSNADSGTGDGGTIAVSAGRDVNVLGGGQLGSSTFSGGHAGSVTVAAGRDILVDTQGIEVPTGIFARANRGSTGNAGSVLVEAQGQIRVINSGAIASTTKGVGRGGTVTVSAKGNVYLDGLGAAHPTGISSASEELDSDNAGQVLVESRRGDVWILNGAGVSASTWGRGNAGSVKVSAARDLHIASPGNGERGGIVTRALEGSGGAAGTVTARAGRHVLLGVGGEIGSDTFGRGHAGNVVVRAGSDIRMNGGVVSAESSGSGSSGKTGGVLVQAGESLRLANHARISIENDAGAVVPDPAGSLPRAGAIRIDAPEVLMTGSQITTRSLGSVAAGRIDLGFVSRLDLTNSSITTTANTGDGGAVQITGSGDAQLRNSQVRSSVIGLRGDGGDISLTAQALVMETGLIEANATSGSGGNVQLGVQALIPSGSQVNGRDVVAGDYLDFAASAGDWQAGVFGGNIIRAVSESGISGKISLTAPQLNLAGAIANLGNPVFETRKVSADACSSEPGSSLSVVGRGGLPPRPRDWILY